MIDVIEDHVLFPLHWANFLSFAAGKHGSTGSYNLPSTSRAYRSQNILPIRALHEIDDLISMLTGHCDPLTAFCCYLSDADIFLSSLRFVRYLVIDSGV
jgi:hypothetical protein